MNSARTPSRPLWARSLILAGAFAAAAAGCGGRQKEPEWPETARKWYDRAVASYTLGDVDDAASSADSALALLPEQPEVRILAARAALARLEFDRAVTLLEGVPGADALALLGRAHWYSGHLEQAAAALEQLLVDPDVRDPWAQSVAKLARTGIGRTPYTFSGGIIGVADMPRGAVPALAVPVEVNGEGGLALIATNVTEVVMDGTGEPQWISVRFGGRVEVHDVPAFVEDLSGYSRQVGIPIKMLIGTNLLRRLNATIDFAGSQFVVRQFEPPPPPTATVVPISYVRGGGMMTLGAIGDGAEREGRSAFHFDTTMSFPVALDDEGWALAGEDAEAMPAVPGSPNMRQGVVPSMKLGAYEVVMVPGVARAGVAELRAQLGVDIHGIIGSGLLAFYRVTLTEGGRALWLEEMPPEVYETLRSLVPAEPPPAEAPPAPAAAPGAPLPSAPPPAAAPPAMTP